MRGLEQSRPTADAVIVGGGLHGCSLALNLALHGVSSVVIEKDFVARHASGVNAGGLRTLGRHVSEIPISLAAIEVWRQLDELLQTDCGVTLPGHVRLAETEADLREIEERAGQLRALGYSHEVVIGEREVRELVPACSPQCIGALYAAHDGFANPFRVTTAYRRRAAQLGVEFLEGTRVLGAHRQPGGWRVETSKGVVQSSLLFNCAGGWAARFAAQLGDALPIEARGSMQIITERLPELVKPVVGSVSRTVSIKQWPNGTVMIGGGFRSPVDLDTGSSPILPDRLAKGSASAVAIMPALRTAKVVRIWSGIEGFTPDGLPVIDRASEPNAFHVAGFSAHGFQLAPRVGQLVAEWVASDRRPDDLAPFVRDRFQSA